MLLYNIMLKYMEFSNLSPTVRPQCNEDSNSIGIFLALIRTLFGFLKKFTDIYLFISLYWCIREMRTRNNLKSNEFT